MRIKLRVWNDAAGMCQTDQCLTSKTCTKVLIHCVLCVYKASGLVKGIFWVVCNLMSVESIFEIGTIFLLMVTSPCCKATSLLF